MRPPRTNARMRCCWLLALVLVVAPARARADDPPPVPAPAPDDHEVAAAATVAGMYTAFAGWMYLAWYRQHKPLSQYKWGGDDEVCAHTLSRCGLLGWAGDTTY